MNELVVRQHEKIKGDYLPAVGRLLVNVCTLPMVPLGMIGAGAGAMAAKIVKGEVAKGARVGSLVGAGLGAVFVVPLLGLAATAIAQAVKKSTPTDPQGPTPFQVRLNSIWKNSCVVLEYFFPIPKDETPLNYELSGIQEILDDPSKKLAPDDRSQINYNAENGIQTFSSFNVVGPEEHVSTEDMKTAVATLLDVCANKIGAVAVDKLLLNRQVKAVLDVSPDLKAKFECLKMLHELRDFRQQNTPTLMQQLLLSRAPALFKIASAKQGGFEELKKVVDTISGKDESSREEALKAFLFEVGYNEHTIKDYRDVFNFIQIEVNNAGHIAKIEDNKIVMVPRFQELEGALDQSSEEYYRDHLETLILTRLRLMKEIQPIITPFPEMQTGPINLQNRTTLK